MPRCVFHIFWVINMSLWCFFSDARLIIGTQSERADLLKKSRALWQGTSLATTSGAEENHYMANCLHFDTIIHTVARFENFPVDDKLTTD